MTARLVAAHLYVGGQARDVSFWSRLTAWLSRVPLPSQESLAQLGSLGVSRLITLGVPPACPHPPLDATACVRIHLEDNEEADLLSHLPECCTFARRAVSEGCNVLVACHAGARLVSAA